MFCVCCCWVEYSTLNWLILFLKLFVDFLSSRTPFRKLLRVGYWSFQLLFQFIQFLLHVFWGSVIKSIYIDKCYIFLRNWPLYIIKCPSLSLTIYFVLTTIFSHMSKAIPIPLKLLFTLSCFQFYPIWLKSMSLIDSIY